MTVQKLSGPVVKPRDGVEIRRLVILLHGLGADGNDLIDLAPYISREIPDAVFVSPNAPFDCDMAPYGYQWFSMQSMDTADMYAGIREAAPILENFIDEQIAAYGVTADKTAILGFSQGCMMSLYTAPRMKKNHIAGVVGCSGSLFGGETLATEATCKPEIILTHGSVDPVVPPQSLPAAEKGLRAAGFKVEAHMIAGLPHGINDEVLRRSIEFLKRVIG